MKTVVANNLYQHNKLHENWFTLHHLLGWGCSLTELRRMHTQYKAFTFFSCFMCAVFLVFLPLKSNKPVNVLGYDAYLLHYHPTAVFILASFIAFFLLPTLMVNRTLRRTHAQGKVVNVGTCFSIIQHLPFSIFVRFGASEHEALWYVLPSLWEKDLRLPNAHYELEIWQGNGCVERLQRLSPTPLTLIREPVNENVSIVSEEQIVAGTHAAFTPPSLTTDERRVLRHAFLRWTFRGAYLSALELGMQVFVGIISGLAFMSLTVFVIIYSTPFIHSIQDSVMLVLFSALMSIGGLMLFMWGFVLIPTWRKVRISPSVTIAGQVQRWQVIGSRTRQFTALTFVEHTGNKHLFIVAPRFRLRVQQSEVPLEITYLVPNNHVTDVQEVE